MDSYDHHLEEQFREPLPIKRREERFSSQHARVIAKFYRPGGEDRFRHVIERVLTLSEEEVNHLLDHLIADFSARHKNIWQIFDRNFKEVERYVPSGAILSDERRELIGAFFTHEFSIQAAAFFNPSIVAHPNQGYVRKGCVRVIMSFRSTGEGHISSIEFRSGILDEKNDLLFDEVSRYVETPEVIKDQTYDKKLFLLKLEDMEAKNEISEEILAGLDDRFTFYDLEAALQRERDRHPEPTALLHDTIQKVLWLARSNYELRFRRDRRISERVIFPVSENESRGIEDARFVRFVDEDGEVTYFATYTAYNGFNILPMLLETKDFISFSIRTLNGKAVQNKDMALFPRQVNGKYMMISRQDGENMYIMESQNVHFWHETIPLQQPKYPWEFIQIGSCGSPVETQAGWLLLTHGVGPMRKYCLGASLLDRDDPSRVIGRLAEPLLSPTEEEREGYVPNVLYTCGALIHNNELIVPYSMSDTASGFAVVPLDALLERLLENGPN